MRRNHHSSALQKICKSSRYADDSGIQNNKEFRRMKTASALPDLPGRPQLLHPHGPAYPKPRMRPAPRTERLQDWEQRIRHLFTRQRY